MAAEPTDLTAYLAPYPPAVQELVLEGRKFLLEMLMPVKELHYDATTAVCAGFSYLPKQSGLFVNFAAYPKHVTLVFMRGVQLADPEHRLKGEGSQVRHIRLADMDSLRDPYLPGLIEQAAAQAPKPDGPVEHEIILKVYAGPKRRPS